MRGELGRHMNGGGSLLTVEDVDRRVDALETSISKDLKDLSALIGTPGTKADGSDATGLYDLCHSLSVRVRPFEKFYYQALGAVKVGIPLLAGSGVLIWFTSGDKLSKMFGG